MDGAGDGDGDPNTGGGDGDGDPNTGEGDGDGDPNTGDGDGDGDSGTGDGDGDPGTGDGDGDSGDSGPGDGDAEPFCGDGIVDEELGEECDDGVDNGPEFKCLADCTLNVCGDGFVGPDEGCDDGNTDDNDGCSASCTLEELPPDAILCNGLKLYECGDTVDNDMDGLIDLDDPECISACDDDEEYFKTGLPGQNLDCKSDCYFDANSGNGDDGCMWNLKCDPENPSTKMGCQYSENAQMCEPEQPQGCLDLCVPLVPSGCDCFGCCLIEDQYIYLGGADCMLETLDECSSCTPNPTCHNF
ncbi:MAG: hypothetical protein R6X02_30335 [Enhygromyxa sp.]